MIRVDRRIGSVELAGPLRTLGARVSVCELPYGDISFSGYGPHDSLLRVGVERKTVSDLLSCLIDNRFSGHQLPGLIETYDVRYLVLEGAYRPSRSGHLESGYPWDFKGCGGMKTGLSWRDAHRGRVPFMYAALDGYLTSIEQQGKVIIHRCLTSAETCFWIWSRYQWWDKPWEKHTSLQPMMKRLNQRARDPRKDDAPEALKFVRATVFRKMVAQIPSIGWVRSKAVEEAFGDWPTLMAASKEDWLAVPGIGPVTARQAWREVHTHAPARRER